MFKVGRDYQVTTGVGDDVGYSVYAVIAWEAPLLKLNGPSGETIVNTCASSFHSAELVLNNDEKAAHAKRLPDLDIRFVSADEDDIADREREARERDAGSNRTTGY